MSGAAALNSSLLIDGRWRPGANGRTANSSNPADGSVLGRFADAAQEDVDAAIAAARRAFADPQWSQNPRLRQMVMLRWADRLEAELDDLARLLTLENGKPLNASRHELMSAISEVRYYAGLARHIPGHVLEVAPGEFSTMIREPAGVCGMIIPWNGPAALLARSLAPALASGCTAVIKAAPQTPLFLAAMVRALAECAGLAPGVVNFFTEIGSAGAERLVASDKVDVISFTGSTSVGKQVMAAAAPTLKKLSLELGGKSACLVFEDVDIQSIAPKLAAAATVIAGQQCTAARRILVHRARLAEMRDALESALSSIVIGSGLEPATQMGPLIDRTARERVVESLERAYDLCDQVVLRATIPGGALAAGSFLTPAIVAHDDPKAFFVQEEIFGPFVTLESFETEEEAAAKANATTYGLSASVWTKDSARAWRVARALANGTVWINDHNKLLAEAETGGFRHSGLGRLHGYDALADFTELKHIYQNAGAIPPFDPRTV